MKYIYPQNLKAKACIAVWSYKHFLIGIALIAAGMIILFNTGFLPTLALSIIYMFCTIEIDGTTILDFIKYAVRFFITGQQVFFWRNK